jgi:hypothetical protein
MKNIITVGELVDRLLELPRGMKLWVGVPKAGGGFEPCLVISGISADPKGKPGRDDCGIILDPSATYKSGVQKTFRTQDNIGTAKYTVSFHDGIKTHSDGSKFFDIRLFRNKKKRDQFIKELKAEGYTEVELLREWIDQAV